MKRSMIAVCLLLSSPSTVMACYEDHNAGPSWFDQQTLYWPGYGNGALAMPRDKLMVVSLVAGGSGVVILLGVLVRAMIRAARTAPLSLPQLEEETPLALPFDGPACEPYCARSEPDFAACGWWSPEIEEIYSGSATWDASSVDPCGCFN
jgi:hypothetical protein